MWAFGRRSGWCGSPDGGLHPARLRSRIRAAGRRGSEFGIGPGGGGGGNCTSVPGSISLPAIPDRDESRVGSVRGMEAGDGLADPPPTRGGTRRDRKIPAGAVGSVLGHLFPDALGGLSGDWPVALSSPLLPSPLLSSPLRSRQMRSEFILEPERSHSVRSPPGEQIRFDLPGGTGRAG